jgi:two-component system nitrogen regulation sensor histidine kinase NtrY
VFFIYRKQDKNSTDLKKQILNIVNLTVIAPVLIGMIYTIFFFRLSFSSIFNNNISKVLNDSSIVVNAYYEEYKEKTSNDAEAIAYSINENTANVLYDSKKLKVLLESFVTLKELSDAIVFVPSQNIILAKNEFGLALSFDFVPKWAFEQAGKNKALLIENLKSNKVKALIELDNFPYRTYLLVARYMDNKILKYIDDTKNAVSEYNLLSKKVHKLQAIFLLIFSGLLIFLIITSRFISGILTKKLVDPIDHFVQTIKIISKGSFSKRLNEKTRIDEMNIFIESFNYMLDQLEDSRFELASRNDFIEAILSQIPSGLVAIEQNYQIFLENNVALQILNTDELKNQFLIQIKNIIIENENNNKKSEYQIKLGRNHFLVKIALAKFKKFQEVKKNFHHLVIFTDITEHIAYQKNLLWTEVAKRITHEIRNPLTPIILSADRLEDKYLEKIENDKEFFLKYINNIKRYANDIALIIDEFIRFGRMPEPVFSSYDIKKIIQEAIAGGNFGKKIQYIFQYDEEKSFICRCDNKQILRALLNIFKNAYEAMQNIEDKIIKVELKINQDKLIIEINDNGPGFPEELLDKITEPYISTKIKGSGLGLSIVKKIIDDHDGQLIIKNSDNHNGFILILLNI